MKKSKSIILFIVVILATVGFGYLAYFGVGADHTGSAATIKRGLDLAGGVSITYQVVGEESPSPEDMADTIFKLKQRVDTYSTEAQVYQEGEDRINIEIPGVSDAGMILEELGKPGSLYFISQTSANGDLNYTPLYSNDGSLVYMDENGVKFVHVSEEIAVLFDESTNDVMLDADGMAITYQAPDGSSPRWAYQLLRPMEDLIADGSVILSGMDVVSAKAGQNQDNTGVKKYVVELNFSSEGAKIFEEATRKAYNNQETIAIYYDDNFICVPSVDTVITGGQAYITGQRDFESADRLASQIRIGGLKLELEELRSQIVGAQLGEEAIKTSLEAGAIGFGIVVVFMIIVYFLPGAASAIALCMYVALDILGIAVFNMTLTLPGIAGIILSIGMAVDANVIIFARIREEIATGKTIQSAVDIGFKKALSAILDGNITTLIAALILILMGSGSVKGFAQTLMLGIILSMFTALFVTRIIINGLLAMGLSSQKLFGVAKERKTFDFVSKGKYFAAISILVIVIGFVFMGINKGSLGGIFNYSLEFKGGTATSVVFDKDYSIAEIDSQIIPYIEEITGDGNVQTQKVEGSNEVVIKTRTLEANERDEMEKTLVEQFGVEKGKITTETISATISSEMKKSSILAVSVAVVCMLIYIWIRFSDYRFGVSSVVALLHDVLVVLAFYAVVRVSVGSTFIACILTVVGYSINATIVIFDRVRENLRLKKQEIAEYGSKKRKKGSATITMDVKEIVNKSISQTISRSLFTSLTTFFMVAVLYILGVTSVKEFALPLIVGILCGTYSSVCLAGCLWYSLQKLFPPKEEEDD